MSTITTIASGDLITNSRTDINNNFSNLNTDKFETSNVDTDTTLAANSDTKVASQKAVKAYVDAGGNVNASTTTKGIVEEATAAEVVARTAAGGTGARLFVNPSTLSSLVKFGGTGADGALSVSSGTTTIDLGSASMVTKNYTSISITGTGKVAFSNPHANGTVIILKSQGAVTLTSNQTPMLDASGMGAIKGTGGTSDGTSAGNSGTNGIAIFGTGPTGGGGAPSFANSTQGTAGVVPGSVNGFNSVNLTKYGVFFATGAGGGGGGAGNNSGGPTTGGDGGNGGGVLIIECAGAWNFTTASGISVAGKAGSNGSNGGAQVGGRGGSGGGGGTFIGLYGSLTANTGTITVSGGSAGSAGTGATGTSTAGAGSGAGALVAGTIGLTASTSPVAGVAGGAGFSIVTTNVDFV